MKDTPVPFSENRKIASRVLAGCVIFAVLAMGPVQLNGARSDAKEVFRSGTYDNYTLSVYTDVKNAAENGNKLANTAAAVIGDKDESISALRQLAARILANPDDENEMLSAFYELVLTSDAVYTRFLAQNTSEEAKREAREQYGNITSASNTVEKDAYFSFAKAFNDDLNGFPAKWLAKLFGIKEMGTGRALMERMVP